jgi:hypothetical protein
MAWRRTRRSTGKHRPCSKPTGTAHDYSSPDSECRSTRGRYDHLAGRLGVGIYGALVDAGALTPTSEVRGHVLLGPAAEEVFGELGISPGAVAEKSGRRRFAFACPDWTERLPHLGGALGAAVCERFFEEGSVRRLEGTRAVALTGKGVHTLQEHLGLRISRVLGPDRPAGDTR